MVAARLGGMTVAELSDRITPGELAMWAALMKVENDEAREQARSKR